MRQHNTHKLQKIGIYKVRNIAIIADLWDTVKLHNLSFYHSTSGFHLPAGINEERKGQENSVDNQVVALQQALAMMQMENMLENGSTEETGTKQKSGIPTVARYPYFIYGVEISVLLKLDSKNCYFHSKH